MYLLALLFVVVGVVLATPLRPGNGGEDEQAEQDQ